MADNARACLEILNIIEPQSVRQKAEYAALGQETRRLSRKHCCWIIRIRLYPGMALRTRQAQFCDAFLGSHGYLPRLGNASRFGLLREVLIKLSRLHA